MSNVSDFNSEIFKSGLSKGNRYELQIVAPSIVARMISNNTDVERKMKFRVDTLQLPSKSLATTETKIYGPVRAAPYTTTYEDLTFTLYCSNDLSERNYFEDWMHYIINYDNNRVRYYSDYSSSDMRVLVFDETGAKTNSYVFDGAFPISIGALSLAYSNDAPLQTEVTMSYRKYISENSYQANTGRRRDRILDGVRKSGYLNTDGSAAV